MSSALTTCAITEEFSTNCPAVSVDDGSSAERRLESMNYGVQDSEAGNWSASQAHFRKVHGSKSLPSLDSDLMKDVRKTSVAALASVVQPLIAALQVSTKLRTIILLWQLKPI